MLVCGIFVYFFYDCIVYTYLTYIVWTASAPTYSHPSNRCEVVIATTVYIWMTLDNVIVFDVWCFDRTLEA